MIWESVRVNIQNIVIRTDNAVLIKMPNNSRYSGYLFWYPLKLVREYSGSIVIHFKDDYNLRIYKKGSGKFNKKVIIASQYIPSFVLSDVFQPVERQQMTHVPDSLEAVNIEALGCLRDD